MNTVKFDYFSLPVRMRWAGCIGLGFALFLCWDQFYWWTIKEEYFFGFLTPVFVGYVLWERWPRIKALFLSNGVSQVNRKGSLLGSRCWGIDVVAYVVGLGGLMFLLLGGVLRAGNGPQQPASLALALGFAAFVPCLAYSNSGCNASGNPLTVSQRLELTGLFLFPALIWTLSAPLLSFVEKRVSGILLEEVTQVVFFTFDTLALPIERRGNVLVLPKGSVGVADACSGIRSLTACLFAGSFLAAVYLDRFWKKVLLVATAMGMAFLGNLLRSLFLTFWAYHYGAESLSGFVHDATGYAVLGATCIGLLILVRVFTFKVYPD